ncbi:MAG: SUF system NifU family Fe-S cluster assembly protein [Candidatus Nanopelagicales bacterium]
MDSLYQEIILDHYRNPVGRGLREPHEAEVHHVNPTCGDEIILRVHLEGAGESATIADISYDGQGCSISQASASVMFEQLAHRTVAEALATHEAFVALLTSGTDGDEDVLGDGVAFAGVAQYPARVKCALLAWMAWKDAVVHALAAQGGGAR